MVSQRIHGVLAKRAGERFRVDRKAKEASDSGDKDLGGQYRVFAVGSRGEGSDPGIGVLTIQSLEALLVGVALAIKRSRVARSTASEAGR